MHFGNISVFLLGLLIVGLIIIVRPISIKLLVRSEMSFKDLSIMSVMTPKGLVPAILASIPIQYGITGGESIQMLSFAVVLLSILICSILVIILSQNPFQFSYLKNVLGAKEDQESIDSEKNISLNDNNNQLNAPKNEEH